MNSYRKLRVSGASALMALLMSSWAQAGNFDGGADPAGILPPGDLPGFETELRELLTAKEANIGSFEEKAVGGVATEGDALVPLAENVLQPADLTSFNYPTNGRPSPLYGAKPFEQKILLFEEFSLQKDQTAGMSDPAILPPLVAGPGPELDPKIERSGPTGESLESFLGAPGVYPLPSEFSNTLDHNPWNPQIYEFLDRMGDSPAEGRPPGLGWAHQRWEEFKPQVFFKTAMGGARVNHGFRDQTQLHGYAAGEFAEGGLYWNTAGAPDTGGTTAGIGIRFHPNMPIQDHKALWTFDGTLPPKLLMARYGEPILMRHYNVLPIDPQANYGFGVHTITTHEHNGHNPAESDGFANAFFFPGQYYDYRWPMQLAGYDTINTDAHDAKAAFPCSPGETLIVNDGKPNPKVCEKGSIKIRGDWRETMSTHWFHDHMLDFTAQNVYKGNAAMMNYYSAIDRGNEALEDGVNLRLPSGSAKSWGNRDYDVNLVLADKAWDESGQLWFNPFNKDGFIGDQLLTNWLYKPYLDVRARRYRFRILNGSVSRFFTIAIVRERADGRGEFRGTSSNVSYDRVPFYMIANDGNILEHAVPFDGTMDLDRDGDRRDHFGQLPTQAIAERYDIVVDFARFKEGDKLYFVNLKEQDTGKGTKRDVPLADVLSGKYQAVVKQTSDGPKWDRGDPVVGKFMEVRVKKYDGKDLSMNPADYVPGKKVMIPLWIHDPEAQAQIATATHREFVFGRSAGTDSKPWTIKTDGGAGLYADMRRLSAAPQLAQQSTDAGSSGMGTMEIWKIINGGNGWSHPVHVHFEEGIILKRGEKDPPEWEKWARKDVYRIGSEDDSTESVEMAIHFREFAGTYMEHCHNTQHEDNAMLLRWDIEHPGQTVLLPSPLPTWDGVDYADTAALPTYHAGDGVGPSYLK